MKTALLQTGLCLSLLWSMALTAQAAPHQPAHPAATAAAAQPNSTTTAPVVQVENAWVRATVPGQKVAAAYMQLQALQSGVKLLTLRSPAAPIVQIHGMQMQGDVMRMFEIKELDLPQGQPLAFKAGGMHIMLMGLPQALVAGQSIDLELRFAGGLSQTLSLPILSAAPTHSTPAAMLHHDHH